MAQPTAYEQYFMELVNRARANPAAEAAREGVDLNQGLAAGTISTAAKQPLAWDPLLIDAARAHSKWMIDTDTFSHTGINGSDPGTRMTSAGYKFAGEWTWGENIATRWGSGVAIDAGNVEKLESGLFHSAGHRVNILSDSFREVGIGLAQGDYKGSPGVMGTQDFAKTAGNPFLTGVAFNDKDGDHFYDPGEGLGHVAVKAVSATGQTFTTESWDAGGYQMELPAGSYTISFSGGGLTGTVTKTATIGTSNVKVDLDQHSDVASTAPTTPTPPPVTVNGVTKTGTAGNDTLLGTASNDVLKGGDGEDYLRGNAGHDVLDGGNHRDVLLGDGGRDVLIGGVGGDKLWGGADADSFVMRSLIEKGDWIMDFHKSEGDVVDLTGFHFGHSGSALFDLGYVKTVDYQGDVQLYVDTNGGGDAFTQIMTFDNVSTASLGHDFIVG